MHDFEPVALGLAEADGDIDVQAGRLSVLDEGKGNDGGIHGDPKGPVRRRQVIRVGNRALRFIRAKPEVLNLVIDAALPNLANEGAVGVAQALAPVRLGKDRPYLHRFAQRLVQTGQVGIVRHHVFDERIRISKGVDLMGSQCVQHIHGGAEKVQTRIGEALFHQKRLNAAGGDADALVFEVREALKAPDGPALRRTAFALANHRRRAAGIALRGLPVAAHHGGDLNLKQHVGKGQGLVLFLGIEQIRHDAVDAAPLCGGDDAAEVVHLEFQLRAQPAGEAISQLDVVSRCLFPI